MRCITNKNGMHCVSRILLLSARLNSRDERDRVGDRNAKHKKHGLEDLHASLPNVKVVGDGLPAFAVVISVQLDRPASAKEGEVQQEIVCFGWGQGSACQVQFQTVLERLREDDDAQRGGVEADGKALERGGGGFEVAEVRYAEHWGSFCDAGGVVKSKRFDLGPTFQEVTEQGVIEHGIDMADGEGGPSEGRQEGEGLQASARQLVAASVLKVKNFQVDEAGEDLELKGGDHDGDLEDPQAIWGHPCQMMMEDFASKVKVEAGAVRAKDGTTVKPQGGETGQCGDEPEDVVRNGAGEQSDGGQGVAGGDGFNKLPPPRQRGQMANVVGGVYARTV